MGRKKNKNPPPPPRGVGSGGGGSGGGSTATPSTTASPYYSLSEIDDDDESNTAPSISRGNNNDDSTEITDADDNTDADSILEMAKRLDAASVISDPSFIEGPENSFQHHPSRGAYRMDEIASESEEEDEDDGSSSESSSDDDESSSDDDDDSESSSSESYDSERYGYTNNRQHNNNGKGSGSNRNRGGLRYQHRHTTSTHNSSGSGGNRNDNNRRRRKKQQHRQQGAAYYDNSRGQQQQFNMSYPGGDRGQRKYSPPRGGATVAAAAAESRGSEQRSTTRGGGGERRSKTSSSQKKDQRHHSNNHTRGQHQQQHDEVKESPKQRRTKMIVIPIVVILIIVVVVVVAVVVGRGTGGGGNATDTQEKNNDNIAFRPIPVPTVSPTYVGLYSCPYGKSGPSATKGCLGYVQCTALGTIIGEIQYCSTGTLYDVRSGVCDFAENVYCATKLPTQDEILAAQESSSSSSSTSVSPPTSGTVGVVPPPMNQPSITVGPITTYNHKLLFEGLTNPGKLNSDDMNSIATNVQDYNNIFYSARVINAYDDGDYILESIGNVTIGLTATKFEYVLNDRRVRRNLRNNFRHLQPVGIVANGLTMEYRQTTKYDTIDESIRPGTIVRYPYSGRYQDRIVGYLKAVDPDTFSKLTRVLFVEGDVVGGIEPVPQPQPAPVPVANPPQPLPPTMKPTSAQTPPPSPPPAVPKTSPPTPAPVTPPPAAQAAKVQGFVFFDADEDGIFDFSGGEPEETFSGVWVNLRDCDTEDWVQTEATEQQGLYSFAVVEEGEYFLEFFKPSPADKYIPTILPAAGSDSSVLDSDLVGSTLTGGARTYCFTIGPEYDSNQFFNAGFRLAPTPPPTPAPSKSPTLTPTNMSYYCAEVSTTSAGNQNFNFLGCQIRCGNGFDECPGNTRCVFADVCAP
jgi:hypothetical protein